MKDNRLKKICKIYLIICIFAYVMTLLLFAILSPIPLSLHISVISVGVIPFSIMLILLIRYKKAFLIIKASLPYIFIAKLTGIALISNGLESTILLFFFIIPFVIYSLEENVIIPSIIMLLIISFFVVCYFNVPLYNALNRINIIGYNKKINNLNYAYIIFYCAVLLISFVQSFYYVKTQISYNRIINQKNLELRREKHFKENMLINATHEIKTPHTIIKNGLQELSRSYPELQNSSLFAAINRELERVINDASDIFDEAKLSIAEKIYDHNMIFCLSCFLREKAQLFNSYAALKEITIDCTDIESNLHIKADDYAIDKVINNLLDNAIKYTPRGGKIEIIARSGDEKIELLIKDNGIGIFEEDLASVFIRYYQVTRKKEVSRGIGLGLFLVKQILDTLKADIEIKSVENEGTAIQIKLDRHFVKACENLDSYSVLPPSFSPDMFKKVEDTGYIDSLQTILIVEDEPSIAKIVKQALSEEYNIITADNGRAALERLKKIKVNLILSDIMMPRMNGIDFCKEVKSCDDYKNIPLIFITAKTGDTEKLKGLKAGAIDYINKPFNSTELYLKVKNNLRLHKLLIENSRSAIIDELEKNYKEKLAQLPPRLKQISDLLYHCPFITNREIAETLDIKLGSVSSYIKELAGKFDLKNERKSEVIEFLRKYRNS